jgi:putative ABC transport system substrate-binding protein
MAGLMCPPVTTRGSFQAKLLRVLTLGFLPTIYSYRYFVEDGGLASYGADLLGLYKRAASYVDHILNGERSAGLPVQQPTQYELIINLKTASTATANPARATIKTFDNR